jgi:hypothetical protein
LIAHFAECTGSRRSEQGSNSSVERSVAGPLRLSAVGSSVVTLTDVSPQTGLVEIYRPNV